MEKKFEVELVDLSPLARMDVVAGGGGSGCYGTYSCGNICVGDRCGNRCEGNLCGDNCPGP